MNTKAAENKEDMESLRKYMDNLAEEKKQKALKAFSAYYEELIVWNKKFNLTAITEREEVAIKHFADSLEGLPYFAGKVLDVGSGAGFPSMPIALLNSELTFTLIDSVKKKVTFLNHIIEKLSLKAIARHIRAEDLARTALRESFDTVTARAVAPLSTLAEYLLPQVKIGGSAVIYKGEAAKELQQAKRAIAALGGEIEQIKKYRLPRTDNERSIIIIRKAVYTPFEYPRSGNKARLSPL